MADGPFWQQCVVSAVQGLGLGAAAFGGWLVFRHQERVKWDEHRFAELRKLQLEALLEALSAVGRYHLQQTRHFIKARKLPNAPTVEQRAQVEAARVAAVAEFDEALRIVAAKNFLLGGEVGIVLETRLVEISHAKTSEEARQAWTAMETDLARWVPPLQPTVDGGLTPQLVQALEAALRSAV
ncbi:hypothetical protein [Anaeromyxobacter oryzae]|uniref:hypothetical protein n=1 Tax=Anaeromyxobacter oryzae TaxID=2918170 RepID=UPI0020C07A4E|nr:hypothetical protein [Anaeromyxobacter oryzae]